jgi:hypothetical protein
MNTIQEVNYFRSVIVEEINRLSVEISDKENLVKSLKSWKQIRPSAIKKVVVVMKKLKKKRVALGQLSLKLKNLHKQFQREVE